MADIFSIIGGVSITLLAIWINDIIKRRDRPDKFVDMIYNKKYDTYENIIRQLTYYMAHLVTAPLNVKELPEYKEIYKELFAYILYNRLVISKNLMDNLNKIITISNGNTVDSDKVVQNISEAIGIMQKELGLPVIHMKLDDMFKVAYK